MAASVFRTTVWLSADRVADPLSVNAYGHREAESSVHASQAKQASAAEHRGTRLQRCVDTQVC